MKRQKSDIPESVTNSGALSSGCATLWSVSGTNCTLGITLAGAWVVGGSLFRAGVEEKGLQIAWKMDTERRSGPKHQTQFNSVVKIGCGGEPELPGGIEVLGNGV